MTDPKPPTTWADVAQTAIIVAGFVGLVWIIATALT